MTDQGLEYLTFLGDFYTTQKVESSYKPKNYICNYETPIVEACEPIEGKVNLRADKEYMVSCLGESAIGVGLANNHIFDYGDNGAQATLDVFSGLGIKYAGIGSDENNHNNPLVVQVEGMTIAICSYVSESTSPGHGDVLSVALLDGDKVRTEITKLKQEGIDKVVINIHWGDEEVFRPKPSDVKLARSLVDGGADLVVGHHAHCIQTWEEYNGVQIFYGLGNLYFDDLEVGSYYSSLESRFTKTYKKKQKGWNKESLAVRYYPATSKVEVDQLAFEPGLIRKTKSMRRSLLGNIGLQSQGLYRLIRFFCLFRVSLFSYVENPRVIRFKDIQMLVGLVKGK